MVAVPALLFAAPVHSSSNAFRSANGFYIGTGFGYSFASSTNKYYRDELPSSFFEIFGVFNGNYVFQPYIGYKFNSHFAVELGYSQPNDLDGRQCVGSTCNAWHYKVYGETLSVLLSEPLLGHNSAYAKVGLGYMHADVKYSYIYQPDKLVSVKQNKVVSVVGFGLRHYFGQHFNVGVAATYQSHNDFIPANSATSLTMGYVF